MRTQISFHLVVVIAITTVSLHGPNVSNAATSATTVAIYNAPPTDNSSSETVWTAQPWGELGIAKLRNAPFPDDSRTTGYKSGNGIFPYAGHYDDPTVVFVIPKNYRPTPQVDLIFHFHGWMGSAPLAVAGYELGDQLTSSGKNAILVIPQGPKNAKDSSIGKLQKPGGFKNLVSEVVAKLIQDGKLNSGTTVGNVVIGGHSGGYMPVGRCLAVGGMNDKIKEVWLWDASYGEWESYAQFVAAHPDVRFRSLFTDHLAPENLRIISLLNLLGQKPALFDEDDLTSAGTSAQVYQQQKMHSPAGKPAADELSALLVVHPLFFMHTHLSHNGVVAHRGYFEKFVRASPVLRPR